MGLADILYEQKKKLKKPEPYAADAARAGAGQTRVTSYQPTASSGPTSTGGATTAATYGVTAPSSPYPDSQLTRLTTTLDLQPREARILPSVLSAAETYRVPPSVLMGLIEERSDFRPEFRGPRTRSGQEEGLGGFAEESRRRYGVQRGANEGAVQSQINGIAQMLADSKFDKMPRQALSKYGGNREGYADRILSASERFEPLDEYADDVIGRGGTEPTRRQRLFQSLRAGEQLPGQNEGAKRLIRLLLGAPVTGDKEPGHSAGGDHDPAVPNSYAQDIPIGGANPAEGEPDYTPELLEKIEKRLGRAGVDGVKLEMGQSLGGPEVQVGAYRVQLFPDSETNSHGSGPHLHAGARYTGEPAQTKDGKIKVPDYVPQEFQGEVAGAARKYDLDPQVLAAQLRQESGFNPEAVSPAGAQGIAQFMPGTAAAVGLNDPFDPSAAIDAQARHMRDLLDANGGDYSLALAAYNAGQGNVDKYGGVPPFDETQNYVEAILGGTGGETVAVAPSSVSYGAPASGGAVASAPTRDEPAAYADETTYLPLATLPAGFEALLQEINDEEDDDLAALLEGTAQPRRRLSR